MSKIKKIDKMALRVLIDKGYVNGSTLQGITVTSKSKNSNGKKYYAKDRLAFIAWDILGYNPDDKEYQRWKTRNVSKKKRKENKTQEKI